MSLSKFLVDVDRFTVCVRKHDNWVSFLGWNVAIKTLIIAFFFWGQQKCNENTVKQRKQEQVEMPTVKEVHLIPTLNYIPFPVWTVIWNRKCLRGKK